MSSQLLLHRYISSIPREVLSWLPKWDIITGRKFNLRENLDNVYSVIDRLKINNDISNLGMLLYRLDGIFRDITRHEADALVPDERFCLHSSPLWIMLQSVKPRQNIVFNRRPLFESGSYLLVIIQYNNVNVLYISEGVTNLVYPYIIYRLYLYLEVLLFISKCSCFVLTMFELRIWIFIKNMWSFTLLCLCFVPKFRLWWEKCWRVYA